VISANTIMHRVEDRVALGRTVLEFAESIREKWAVEAQ
jgi:hypothetical protein